MKTIKEIKNAVVGELSYRLVHSGIVFRIYGRVKSERSLEHKMKIKGEKYRKGSKIQDMIAMRVILYHYDDLEPLEMFLCSNNLVDRAVDEPDVCTFRPTRVNLVKKLDDCFIEDFRKALPEAYAPYIDETYEIQVRTVFSEGWHEVEHDMRYKCKEDWIGCDTYSRQLNGIIATLENAEWSMGAIFREMSNRNMLQHNYTAMLRNQLRIRIDNDHFSPAVEDYLNAHPDIVTKIHETDRMVFILTLLNQGAPKPLTYDNIVFLINRIDIMDEGLYELEKKK